MDAEKTLERKKVVNDEITTKIIELRNAKKSIRDIASEVGSVEEPYPTSSRQHEGDS